MKNKSLFEKFLDKPELSNLNKKIDLNKNAKWMSFGTYIMTVEGFYYSKGDKTYFPLLNTVEYKSENCTVKLSYNDEDYFIESKKLYENVSKGDKVVVTIKYIYDKDDKLIHSDIHSYHPYPLSNS
ncbi:DNA polymerase III subunit delta [Terrisporobacter sp.]|uniref:DNA polymerase III subunit delta n=1 Tax=Terrisporobacter sp. TaxID=1965305 RepID=UPI0026198F09|nr:DNA polymerase III subunit delta [Terrisporobacter sp.]